LPAGVDDPFVGDEPHAAKPIALSSRTAANVKPIGRILRNPGARKPTAISMSVTRDATNPNNRKAAGGKLDGFRTGTAIAFPVVVRERATVVVVAEGVIELGVTVQVDSAGAPEHASEINWL
jgi:hypothetical protein